MTFGVEPLIIICDFNITDFNSAAVVPKKRYFSVLIRRFDFVLTGDKTEVTDDGTNSGLYSCFQKELVKCG